MKKIILLCLLAILFAFSQQSLAQPYGKWVVPTVFPTGGPDAQLMEFYDNLIQYSPLNTILSSDRLHCQITAGAYDANYNLNFYIIDETLYYGNNGSQNLQWNSNPIYTNQNIEVFGAEVEVISKPETLDEYFVFYTEEESNKNVDYHFRYKTINMSTGTPQVSGSNDIINTGITDKYLAFAISEGKSNQRKLYTLSSEFPNNTGGYWPAGLYQWLITKDGVSDDPEIIINVNTSSITEDDFLAYNLELKYEDDNNYDIAWITGNTNSCSKVFIVIDGNEHVYNPNLGRIGGIEFSTFENNILYVSTTNAGIIKLDYTNGNLTDIDVTDSDYGHTFLQLAPDGNIYGVSNDGANFAQIDMTYGSYNPNYSDLPPQGYIVSTYRIFDNTKYYILPENHRTYDPLLVNMIIIDESCPGYADGEASICISGGTPGIPPDEPEYTITCIGPGGNEVYPDSYDPITNCFHFTELSAGTYSFEILDAIDTYYEGSFIIESYYYDVDLAVIESNMSWDELYPLHSRIEYGIVVRNNAVLSIDNALLEFGPDAKVIIEPGATIQANNTVFTNLDCVPLHKWKGIEVWGDINDNQYAYVGHPLAQGFLKLNGSTVEHAENGVSLWKEEERIWSSAGGIVQAINSDFLNNTKSVHFVPYENTFPPTGQPCNNLSYFKLCTFNLDNNYIDNTMFYKHVDLHGVNGIRFSGCDFLNTATSGVALWNNGIASYGSGFKVDEGCMPPCFSTEPSTFNGFYWAISVLGTAAPYVDYPFEVRNSDFANNVIGIYASECEWPVIIDNTFVVNHTLVTDGICDFNFGIGIDMYHSYGFAIEDNEFNNNSTAGNSQYSGIRVDNCPSDHDIIYRNIFTDLSYGNYAEGTNRLDPGDDQKGVEYQCNLNNNNVVDFIVTDEEVIENAMIRAHHGSSNTASGNTFSEIIHSDIWHFRNEGRRDIDWYYCDPCPDEEPITIFTLPPGYFDKHISTNVNSCPDHYGGGGGINITLNNTQKLTKQQEYAQNLADYNSVKALFESLVDGGNTDAEIMDIELAQPDDMWALRSQLLGHSPHLSQEVLREMADRTDVFPDDVLLEILSANPDELKVDTLLLYLEQKEDPLPDYMISILYQVTNNVSYKTVLKREMAQYYAAKSQAAQEILRSLANDSIFNANEYRNWLDNFGGIEADKKIVAGYFAENDTASAMALLNLLPDIYELEGSRLDAFNDYKDLVLMQYAWKQEGRTIFELDSSELMQLSNYG